MSSNPAPDLFRVAVILPTRNAESYFDVFSGPLLRQGIVPEQVLIIDSESTDQTVARARDLGFRVHEISGNQFNHGGTRRLGSSLVPWAEILVYTTQDAAMASSNAVGNLIRAFEDPLIGAAYGRQIPHADADIFAIHHCNFNYPSHSGVRAYSDRLHCGYKAVYLSDSFAAYRASALASVGGFPQRIIGSEDFYLGAKLLQRNWKLAYVAEAAVFHSHSLTLEQLFRRYFDIGVMHSEENWILEEYGKPQGEGMRLIRSELSYLWKQSPHSIPKAFLRTLAKYIGYQIGCREAMLSNNLKRRLGSFSGYWSY